jgi:hypothetical protein
VHCTRQRIGYGRAIRASHKETFGVQTVASKAVFKSSQQHLNHLSGPSIPRRRKWLTDLWFGISGLFPLIFISFLIFALDPLNF